MKIKITEEQLRKFNKDNINSGKLGKAIESIIRGNIDEKNICDIVVIDSNNVYVALILFNGPSPLDLNKKLMKLLKQLLDQSIIVMITDSDCNSKTVNESVGKEIKSVSKIISSLPRPDKLLVNRKTGETTGDDFFWPIIDILDYKSDNDYRRVKDLMLDLYRFTGALSKDDFTMFINIMDFKNDMIDRRHGHDIRGVSDDSWGDLKADIVSRGKDFYNKALSDFNLVQKMADDDDYKESFNYAIPYEYELD